MKARFFSSDTVFFTSWSSFSGKQASVYAMHPGKKELKTRSKRDQSEITARPLQSWAHMCRTRAHKFTHFRTRSQQLTSTPTFRLTSAPANASLSGSPAQPCAHASQMASMPAYTPAQHRTRASPMVSTPAQAHPLSPAHTPG